MSEPALFALWLGVCVAVPVVLVALVRAGWWWVSRWWWTLRASLQWSAQPLATEADAEDYTAELRDAFERPVALDAPTVALSPLLHHTPTVPVSRLRTTPAVRLLEPVPVPEVVALPARLALAVAPVPEHVESYPVGGRVQQSMVRTVLLVEAAEVDDPPIYREVFREWDAERRYAKHRVRLALKEPTQEFNAIMAASYTAEEIAGLDAPCTRCEFRDHEGCPGCACGCTLEVSRV